MPLGRTRQLSVSPGMEPTMLRLIGEQRAINRDLDRRKPVTSPSVFNNDAQRPPASKNPRRIIFVRQADGSFRGQYSDGSNWQTFLATVVSFATPTIGYASTGGAGVATTTIRSDATLKFPSAIMSVANSSLQTLTDDAVNQTLTGSLGQLRTVQPGGYTFTANAGGISPSNCVFSVSIDPSVTGQDGGISSVMSQASVTGRTLYCWDARMSNQTGWVLNTATIAGFFQSAYAISLSGGSGTDNKMYGAKLAGPNIRNTTGGWSEVATLYCPAPTRFLSSPTVTTLANTIIEPPTMATSDQIGLLIRQASAQATATNRLGIDILAQNSGTNRWSIRTADRIENTVTDIHTSASGKGFIIKASDDNTRWLRIRALYNGGAPSITIDDIGTTQPTP